jgi:hypothetical protein
MKWIYKLTFIPVFLLLGCDNSTNEQTLSVNSVKGSYPLSSIYLFEFDNCTYDSLNNLDLRQVLTLNGDVRTTDTYTYPSTNASCTGTETHRYSVVSKVSIEGDLSTSWDFSTVPNRDDGAGPLPAPVTTSKVKSIITNITDYDLTDSYSSSGNIGSERKRLLYVDDSLRSAPFATVYTGSIISGKDADAYPLLMDPDPIFYVP